MRVPSVDEPTADHHGPVVGAFGENLVTIRWRGHDGSTDMTALLGGADGHRTGRFYNNLLPQYLANTPVDFPFGADLTSPAITVIAGPPPAP